jgi:aspartate beta-hydroxylase
MPGVYDMTAKLVRRLYDSRIATPAILDDDNYFPQAPRYTERWQAIRDEALAIAADLGQVPRFHELMPSQADISANDRRDWRMFVLKAYGVPFRNNLARCPTLATLLAESPDVLSATLSFLAPHKHIPRHRGPFRGIVRYYLGLSIPTDADGQPAAVLSLDDIEYYIGDGQGLLWDDTYPHEVWNNSDQVRIALLMDIRRRHMPLDMELLSRFIISLIGTTVRMRKPAI